MEDLAILTVLLPLVLLIRPHSLYKSHSLPLVWTMDQPSRLLVFSVEQHLK